MSGRPVKASLAPVAGFAICYLAYTAIYVARLNLSMAAPELSESGILTAAQIGVLGGIFSVVYACGRLFNGILNDRIVPWIMIAAGLAAVGAGNVISGFFPPFAAMAVLWGVNAYGQSMLWGSGLHVISALYEPSAAKTKSAQYATAVAMGNLAGVVFNAWIIARFGARYAYFVPGALCLLIGVVAVLALRHVPLDVSNAGRSIASSLRLVGFRRVRTMLFPALCHGIVKDNISLWMAVYFVSTFAIDLKESSYYLLLVPAVGLLGRLSYGLAYRACRSRENLVSACAFGLCAGIAAILLVPGVSPLVAALCLSVIYAAVSVVSTSVIAVFPMRLAKLGETAATSGLMDFATYIGAGIGSVAYGFVIKRYGGAGYLAMFASWVVLAALSSCVTAAFARRDR